MMGDHAVTPKTVEENAVNSTKEKKGSREEENWVSTGVFQGSRGGKGKIGKIRKKCIKGSCTRKRKAEGRKQKTREA